MPQLRYMPWCHLDKPYQVGDIALVPLHRDQPMEGLDRLTVAYARLILRAYRNTSGLPVRNAVLVRYKDRDLLADLSADENAEAFELGQVAAFAGLANREYFTQMGNYCNADCFRMYGQPFREEPSFSAITSRRADGRNMNGIAISELSISEPPHVGHQKVKLDEGLIQAICAHRTNADADEWARWQNAISCFNQANTDDSASMYQVEWVLLCSAFEHLLGSESKADDVARRFAAATPDLRSSPAIQSPRKLDRWRDEGQPLRQEWMREFYRIRGDFAHGRLTTRQPCAWRVHEHLFLSAVAFPLLVRCLLKAAGRYTFSEADERQLWAFESAADGDCFAQINNPETCDPFLWPKLLQECRSEQMARRIQTRLEEAMNEEEAPTGG